MPSWPLQDAKAKFSELVDTTLKKGPQVVTRRGIETVVVVPIDEWRRLTSSARPDIKKVLIEDGPKFEIPLPDRKSWRWRRRPPVEFE
jgi:antitoxin Phd